MLGALILIAVGTMFANGQVGTALTASTILVVFAAVTISYTNTQINNEQANRTAYTETLRDVYNITAVPNYGNTLTTQYGTPKIVPNATFYNTTAVFKDGTQSVCNIATNTSPDTMEIRCGNNLQPLPRNT